MNLKGFGVMVGISIWTIQTLTLQIKANNLTWAGFFAVLPAPQLKAG